MLGHPGNAVRSFGFGAFVLTITLAHAGCGGSGSNSPGFSPGENAGGSGGAGGGGLSAGGGGGGSVENTPDGGNQGNPDGGSSGQDAASETGSPSGTYPAFPVDVAQVVNNGGSVLTSPVVVTVTWSTDPGAETYNTFGDTIGPSTYWKDINSEYKVGASTSGTSNHVSITTAAPSSFADSDLDSLVETNAGTSWPAPTANTLYAIYLPPGSTLTSGGQDLCSQGVGGYHTESQNKNLVYAIMPHCSGFQTADVELSASHELNEASTDPHPGSNPAYAGFDANHLAFEFFNSFQDELGDACESFVEATDAVDFTPYTVQRQWSNASAAAGSHWCLPALAEPFYNTTFLASSPLDTISVNTAPLGGSSGTVQTKGFKIAVGASRTFAIGYFSDVPTNGAFTLDVQGLGASNPIAQDQNGNAINNGDATITIDKTSGQNGDTANVTVTPKSFSTLGVTFLYIRAQLPGAQQHHYLPVLISQN
jgi:hypothetical protein